MNGYRGLWIAAGSYLVGLILMAPFVLTIVNPGPGTRESAAFLWLSAAAGVGIANIGLIAGLVVFAIDYSKSKR